MRTPGAHVALRHYLNGRSLFICGNAGTGKTSFFKSLRDSGMARRSIFVYSLGAHGNDYESEVIEAMRAHEGDEVVVDDVGCESDWGGRRDADLVFRILAVREGSRLRTHITSNADRARLQRYDERVRSRFRAFEFVAFVGKDNRAPSVNEEAVKFRRKCADPSNWVLCAKRCPLFVCGHCLHGRTEPPTLVGNGGTPESVCGVGRDGGIPYRAEHLEAERQSREARRQGFARFGLPIPDYLREVGQ